MRVFHDRARRVPVIPVLVTFLLLFSVTKHYEETAKKKGFNMGLRVSEGRVHRDGAKEW